MNTSLINFTNLILGHLSNQASNVRDVCGQVQMGIVCTAIRVIDNESLLSSVIVSHIWFSATQLNKVTESVDPFQTVNRYTVTRPLPNREVLQYSTLIPGCQQPSRNVLISLLIYSHQE